MKTSDSITNLASALAKMQPELGVIGKSGENKFDNYTYATLADYIKGTRDIMSKHGFFMVASVEKLTQLTDRATRNGSIEHAVQISLTVRLIHQSGEWIETSCIGEGQDRTDKAVYKAITGARKYAMASLLGLATSDDPEADEEVGLSSISTGKKANKHVIEDMIVNMRKSKDLEELRNNFEAAMEIAKNTYLQPDYLNKIILAKNHMKEQLLNGSKEH
ncbi:MAG: hypothetical protein K0S11_724 [Gammaproteobacteria bacterium]|nr:hypothetical protein [Gammaproteobacteria bacterium]